MSCGDLNDFFFFMASLLVYYRIYFFLHLIIDATCSSDKISTSRVSPLVQIKHVPRERNNKSQIWGTYLPMSNTKTFRIIVML